MEPDYSSHTQDIWIGDILALKDLILPHIIVHQVNCHGVMGAGIALQIKKKYPVVYEKYRDACVKGTLELGMIQPVRIDKNLVIINLAGQRGFGTKDVQTDYVAHLKAWPKVQVFASRQKPIPIIFAPAFIGCGLGGGDPAQLIPIIELACPKVVWVNNVGDFGTRLNKGEIVRSYHV